MCARHNHDCQRLMEPLRRRKGSNKRSRTGCRTCRARHVKCDETPGACRNCTSSGRACDGYDLQRLPPLTRSRKKTPGFRLLPEVGCGIRWHYTIPTLAGFFSSVLWEKLVLQMSYAEPAVYHAAVALSAIHQDVEMYGMPLPGQELDNTWHKFTMEQAGRSYAILNERHFSQDPRLREVMLLCCLLFVLLELLRGRYDDAFQHLEGGLRILHELKAQRQLVIWAPHESPVEECLVAAFAQLDIQAANFKIGGPILRIENDLDRDTAVEEDRPVFNSIREVRRTIEPLLSRAFHFLMDCWALSNKEIVSHYKWLQLDQQELFSQFHRFAQQFDPFYHNSYPKLYRKDQKGADMINILRDTTSLAIRTSLIRDEALLRRYQPEYTAALFLIEEVMRTFRDRPNYTLDMGVVPPLYIISIGAPDYSLRWHAIELLRSWPHREGVFDSNWAAFIAEEHVKVQWRLRGFVEEEWSRCPWGSVGCKKSTPRKLEKGRWSTLGHEEYSIEQGLEKTKCMADWPCVQSLLVARSALLST
ncbi:hypothetical protein BDV28DRAFT_155245 [Aspergillus coremiiformis]|uniref:Zn(2)-C6 fungal-type domain-containing protein n=1 Tax=Aspergillus coremiiformis TaxID=138285 RepID=A0A5N6ZEM6_9EURO|nr:hypothetical protein BDV28DRAFT_155245 [Aspergillus coremiiformis]